MPIYEYECPTGHKATRLSSIDERAARIRCDECGKTAQRVLSAAVVRGAGEEYLDENLSDYGSGEPFLVKSAAHKRQRLKDLGLTQKEPTYKDRQRKRTGRLTFDMR